MQKFTPFRWLFPTENGKRHPRTPEEVEVPVGLNVMKVPAKDRYVAMSVFFVLGHS